MKIVTFFKRNKEKRAIRCAKKLRAILTDLGYVSPSEDKTCSYIYIWEYKGFSINNKIEFSILNKIEF